MRLPAPPANDSPTDWAAYLLDRAPAMMAYVDTSLRYRFASPAYTAWMGIEGNGLIGRRLEEVIAPSVYARIEPGVSAALAGEPMVADREIRRDDGKRYAQATFTPDVGDDGVIRGVSIILADISGRHVLEARLKESERRFSQAFRHAAIGMALVLPDGRWLQVNEALSIMLGYSEQELLTSAYQDITHPDDLATDLSLVQ
jgi:PAS domain S-box-containing protein